jgi:dTDP-4-dehydrorhamnose reductase
MSFPAQDIAGSETRASRILVTGGSGLLGAEVARLISEAGHYVLSGYNTHFPVAGSPIRLDLINLTELQQVIQETRPDFIIHTAAVSDVDLCEGRPDMANLVNGEATGKIGETAARLGAYVIYISTDYVFDGKAGSYREEDKPNPVNHYGSSKLLGEELLKESGARSCVARTSVVYGWGREHRPNFATWVLGQLKSNQPLKVVNDQFASPTLNSNLAEMILELTSKQLEGIIHLAGATRIDRYNFAKQIAETFLHDPNLIEPVKSDQTAWKAKRPTDSSLNVGKAERLLERKPLELNEALEQFRAANSH